MKEDEILETFCAIVGKNCIGQKCVHYKRERKVETSGSPVWGEGTNIEVYYGSCKLWKH